MLKVFLTFWRSFNLSLKTNAKMHEGRIGRDPERVRADSYREPGSEDMRERHGASVRSRSLPRVSTTTRHETRPVYQEGKFYSSNITMLFPRGGGGALT